MMIQRMARCVRAPTYMTSRWYSVTAPGDLNAQERMIFDKLAQGLSPQKLEVRDVSGGCGSMYAIEVEAEAFRGKPMVRQHRMVNEVLKEEIAQWHGLQLRTRAPAS